MSKHAHNHHPIAFVNVHVCNVYGKGNNNKIASTVEQIIFVIIEFNIYVFKIEILQIISSGNFLI